MTKGAARLTALVGVLAWLPLAPGSAAPAHAAPPFWPWGSIGGPWESSGAPPFTLPVWPGPPTGPGVIDGVQSSPRPNPPAVVPCRIRSGSRADFVFTAVLRDGGRHDRGRYFEFGAVQDLLIEVRWASLHVSARQRLELYAPDGHLYQMITTTLSARAEPSMVRVPVSGSWITSATLTGTWCAKVFLDDELHPAAADDFELRFPRAR
jgi:hypothetical protein